MSRTTSLICAVAVAFALGACGSKVSDARSGSALVEVQTSALSTAVFEITVDVSDGGTALASVTLTKSAGSSFRGSIHGLPVNVLLTFAADATATDGTIYLGTAQATISSSSVPATVTLKLQEFAPPTLHNGAPRLTALTSSARFVPPGGSVTVAISAADPDGDPLTYAWSAPVGTFVGAGLASAVWTAPATSPHEVTLEVVVSDGKSFAKASLLVTVTSTSSLQNVAVVAVLNDAPAIAGIVNEPQYDPATGAVPFDNALTLTVTDTDGPDPLTFLWELDNAAAPGCFGSFLDPASGLADASVRNPVFSPTSGGDGGLCAATVTVQDGLGASNVGTVVFAVDVPATAGVPRLVFAYQSATGVGAGAVAFVKASFLLGVEQLAAGYTWTAAAGAEAILIEPASLLDLDLMRVTFPAACRASGVDYTVSATALDPITSQPMDVTDPATGTTSTVSKDFVIRFCP